MTLRNGDYQRRSEMSWPGKIYLITLFTLGALGLVSCSSGGGGGATGASKCGPTHEMAGFVVDWEYMQCARTDTIRVDQSSADSNGAPLGAREANWGKLSVSYHGLLNQNFTADPNFGVFFKANGYNNNEANWQFMAYDQEGTLGARLILQRHDGACGDPLCEMSDATNELQFDNSDETVQFECSWSLSEIIPDGKIWCTVRKSLSGQVREFWTPMVGPFVSLDYAGVGKRAFDGPYSGFPAQVSDFKFTLFQ